MRFQLRKFSRRTITSCLFVIITYVLFKLVLYENEIVDLANEHLEGVNFSTEVIVPQEFSVAELRLAIISKKLQRISKSFAESRNLQVDSHKKPNYNVHVFYYAWYRTNALDGYYSHWFFTKDFSGPNNTFIDSYYFPKLGLYSSFDDSVVNMHFYEIAKSGIGVVLVWWNSDEDVYHLMQIAKRYGLKIALQVNLGVKNRSVRRFFKYMKKYAWGFVSDDGYYKVTKDKVDLPVFYVHNSFEDDVNDWGKYLDPRGKYTIRNTSYNGVYIGAIKDKNDLYRSKKSGFDGFYTFLASNGHTFSSSWKNWEVLGAYANKNNMIFSATVSPGYVTRHDWLSDNNINRDRAHGHYYDVAWRTALNNARFISINSFNDWNSGTQIEAAKSGEFEGTFYYGYEPKNSDFYLNLTNWWIGEFNKL